MTKHQLILLTKKCNKDGFDCSNPSLNHYIKKQASQDVKRNLSVCFVLCKEGTFDVIGYFTLSNLGIDKHLLPESFTSKLPKSYRQLPSTLLGRLAITLEYQGKGLGEYLLIEALKKSYESSLQLGSYSVVVDPIDDQAKSFYLKYGFIELPDSGKMLIAMKTLSLLLAKR